MKTGNTSWKIFTRGGGYKSRGAHTCRRRGFTLVEVIVVLVILAILAAIGIPALTGYIDKANDKKFISSAKDRVVACRALLSEAYAKGDLGTLALNDKYLSMKLWTMTKIFPDFRKEAQILLGLDETKIYSKDKGYWSVNFVAPKDSDVMPWETDGFSVDMYPDGAVVGNEIIFVTYRLSHIDGSDAKTFVANMRASASYEEGAGYQVYRFTIPENLW